MSTLLLFVLMVLAALVSVRLFLGAAARRRSVRLVDASVEAESTGWMQDEADDTWPGNWLSRAGFRDPSAAAMYWGATAGLTALALSAIFALNKLGALDNMSATLSSIPAALAMYSRQWPKPLRTSSC